MNKKDITKKFNTNECLIYNLTEKVTNLEKENEELKESVARSIDKTLKWKEKYRMVKKENEELKEERNLKKELEELNITSFDSDDITTKEDMFVSLDAIRNFIEENPDEEALAYISQKKKLKNKAEEYLENKSNWKNGATCVQSIRQAYIDGYEQGQKDTMSYKDNYIKDLDGIIDTFKKENEELKNQILGLQNNIEGQKARKYHHIKENVKLKSEVAELKAQIEKMKNCENCKWNFIIGDYEPCNKCNDENDKWECVE